MKAAIVTAPGTTPIYREFEKPGVKEGEELPEMKVVRLRSEVQAGFDVVFSIGTSSSFHYIAAPVLMARATGIPTVEINPESTAVTRRVDFKIAGGAAEALDRIWEQYLSR